MRTGLNNLGTKGFAVVGNVLDASALADADAILRTVLESSDTGRRTGAAYGVRQLLEAAPALRDWVATKTIRELVEPIAGPSAQIVRAIYFDKTPDANWKVAWHQDLTIAVRELREVAGFTNWTMKGCVAHAQPPASILENILTVRIHLDQTDETNGALRVIAGSHRDGRLGPEAIEQWKAAGSAVLCRVPAGGTLLMRPLLLHASSPGTQPARRRVIHLEFSTEKLPGGLEWYGT
jgi:ectoine hydroxylase-related dioxygenase (phytanoyl-CoA dioxygenase family)